MLSRILPFGAGENAIKIKLLKESASEGINRRNAGGRMKVGLYLQTWHVGGVASYIERLAEGLAAGAHSVVVITGTPYGKRDPAGRAAYERLSSRKEFSVHCLHLNAYHPKERSWRAAEKINALNCDALLLSAHKNIADGLQWIAPGMAFVGIGHSVDAWTYEEFLRSHQYCNAYVGVSAHIAEKFRKMQSIGLTGGIHHIQTGIPIGPARGTGVTDGPAKMLVVCRIVHEPKRVLHLPLLWKNYRARGGLGTLTVCGTGEDECALRKGFATELASGEVIMPGNVETAKMGQVYNQHDILLSLSVFEGFPLVPMEAAAEGVFPILSKTDSGHPEIVDTLQAGRLCEIGDLNAFTSALLDVTADLRRLREQREVIAQRAREQFNIQTMVQTYDGLLQEVVASHKARGSRSQRAPLAKKPRVDPLRGFLRRWQYRRHYGWQK